MKILLTTCIWHRPRKWAKFFFKFPPDVELKLLTQMHRCTSAHDIHWCLLSLPNFFSDLLRNVIHFLYCSNYYSHIEKNGRDQDYLIHTLRQLKSVVTRSTTCVATEPHNSNWSNNKIRKCKCLLHQVVQLRGR